MQYGGMRVKLMAMLGNVRIPLQVDIGAGDAVVPALEVLDYPGLLDRPRARLRAYRPETSIAEKTEAMVRLALANSRMKDFFDIHRLAETRTFDGETMRLAVAATFARRGIEIPDDHPLALTGEFADDAQKKNPVDSLRATCTTARDGRPVRDRRDTRSFSLARASGCRSGRTMAAHMVEWRPVERAIARVRPMRFSHHVAALRAPFREVPPERR